MYFWTSATVTTALLFLGLVTSSRAGYGLPQLQHERRIVETRRFFDTPGSLFNKRDECGTQFGPTYVDCGHSGCYQPSLGEICCASVSGSCEAGNYCVGNHCCPNGLLPSCCGTGFNCPANVSDYYTTASTSPPSGSTSLPVAVSTSTAAATTSARKSSSAAASLTSTSTPATPKTISSVVVVTTTSKTSISVRTSSANLAGVSSTLVPASGVQEVKLWMGVDGAMVALLGLVGFVAGLM